MHKMASGPAPLRIDYVITHADSVQGSYDNADSHQLLRVLRDRLEASA